MTGHKRGDTTVKLDMSFEDSSRNLATRKDSQAGESNRTTDAFASKPSKLKTARRQKSSVR